MTGPEHYDEAERVMAGLTEISNREQPMDHQGTLALAAVAQVHATLALAAATALSGQTGDRAMTTYNAWHNIAGEQK